MKNQIEKNIHEGLDYLKKSQIANGSFPSLTSSNPKNFKQAKICHSTFSTALILSCLNDLSEKHYPQIIFIKKKAADFLLSQKSSHWTFNYWDRESDDAKKMPYPDDLDDTFCSLSALYRYNPDLIDGKVLAKSAKILTTLEIREGGPYKTWLVPSDSNNAWKDVDLAVNNNIAYFLSLQEVTLPRLKKLAEKAINDQKYDSPYYPSAYPVIYFISRWYSGKNKENLITQAIHNLESKNLNILDMALLNLALFNLGAKKEITETKIKRIIRGQTDGHWSAFPFYTGINPAGDNRKYYAGSPSLTTAFCLNLLNKINGNQEKNNSAKNKSILKAAKNIDKEILKKIKENFSNLDIDLRKIALSRLDKIITKNKSWHVTSLPNIFYSSIKKKVEITEESLINLGAANAYGWIAYTIYDDFLDGERKLDSLSVANFCLRELTLAYADIFNDLNLPKSHRAIFRNIMTGIDNANHWEIEHCRVKINNSKLAAPNPIPNFNNNLKLADRSLGHAIGPVAILMSQGYHPDSKEIRYVLNFFRHYIAARQLNDDAHDWEDDLKKGIITSANSLIFKELKNEIIDLDKDLPEIKNIFWRKLLPSISGRILSHLKQAEISLGKISAIKDKNILMFLLDPIRSSAIFALEEHKKTAQFLGTYKKYQKSDATGTEK